MRIACPTCQAAYDVPDALIGKGRRLRCAKCDNEWLVSPAAADPPAPPPLPISPAPGPSALGPSALGPPDLGATPPPVPIPPVRRAPVTMSALSRPALRGPAMALWAAWIGSCLLLGGLLAGAWVYRGPIVEAWPPATRVYLLLGAAQQDG